MPHTTGRAVLATLARAALILALAIVPAAAQQPTAPAPQSHFQLGRTYAGPRIWLGNINGAVAIGGQIERALTKPTPAGTLSGGVGVDYYSWSFDYPFGSYSYSVIPLQFFSNYHFAISSNPRLDPYLGLALVYSVVNATWEGTGTPSSGASASGATFAGQGGLRYFISPNFALQGQIGFGYGTLGLGTSWSF
jgi:hypothetical protein